MPTSRSSHPHELLPRPKLTVKHESPSTAATVCSELVVSGYWLKEGEHEQERVEDVITTSSICPGSALLGNHTVTGECPNDDKNPP